MGDINWYSDLCILSCNCMQDYICMLEKGKKNLSLQQMNDVPQVNEFQKESKKERKSQEWKNTHLK